MVARKWCEERDNGGQVRRLCNVTSSLPPAPPLQDCSIYPTQLNGVVMGTLLGCQGSGNESLGDFSIDLEGPVF